MHVEFSFNRTFLGNKKYPYAGSWGKTMRPDYTLSIWPYGVDEEQAEHDELIVHIHFDAKYRIENLQEILGDEKDHNTEDDVIEGTAVKFDKPNYKRDDLLKMHSYKDAIRRSWGAYVLYPGEDKQSYSRNGFHELLPGIGAFSIIPSRTATGLDALKNFLNDILTQCLNRASQREEMAFRTYELYKQDNPNIVNEPLPEPYGKNKNVFPMKNFVVVGYYKNADHFNWIVKNHLYNVRTEDVRGSLNLGPKESGAKYLLLHTRNELITGKFFRITGAGPNIFKTDTSCQTLSFT